MKSNRINIDENYLSSDVVSMALTYFLNPQRPSLKYFNALQNLLQRLEKRVLVSYLKPFEFFFQCRKQVEATLAKSGE
jgi:hypothetical protein